jgi:F0F1-type ATP synthase membrane subunit b/b'
MQINLTFFIQILNVFVSYWFLKRFMFKPVVDFLKARDEKEKKTKNILNTKEQNLLELERKKQEELEHFQLLAKRESAVIEEKEIIIPVQSSCFVDKQEIERLTEISKNILVRKVPHVD